MEDERIREELALNERIKNDVVRKRENEMKNKIARPPKAPLNGT